MTREDAIEVIKEVRFDINTKINGTTRFSQALEMAIKALEHPEKNVIAVVPCGDAISRSDVLKLMQDNWHTHNGDWAMQESMDDIRALPSITPQPRKGHWIPTYGNVKCSVCGSVKDSRDVGKATHYCDFCGAKMQNILKKLRIGMIAMLEELQLEIEEMDSRAGYDGNGMPTFSTDYIRKKKVNELIQQKINALGGNEDDNC